MGFRLPSYLFRNRYHRFYFRRPVPQDLQAFFPRKSIYKSLETCEFTQAVDRVAQFIALTNRAFERIRQEMSNKNSLELKVILELKDFGKLSLDLEPHEVETGKSLIETAIAAAKASPAAGKSVEATDFSRLPLSTVIEKYCSENETAGNWSAASAKDYRGDFRQFVEIFGNPAIGEVNREALVKAKDKWLRLPANLKKRPELATKTVDEVLKLGLQPQSAANVSKKWERVRAFFGWAHTNVYVDSNHADKLKIKAKGKSYEKFSTSDLNALFRSDEYVKGEFSEAFQYWVPLIGLFSGARLEEITQMHIADIRLHGERNFFHITTEVDGDSGAETVKRLKNESSDRVCPIHPKLIELGLMTYVEELKSQGYDRLFPELRSDGSEKVGARASEWFTEYRRRKSVGALEGRSAKVFHSFRHTLNAEMQARNVPQEIRERICGHKSQSVNVAVYGGKDLDTLLVDAIDRVKFNIEFVAYRQSKAYESARKRASRRTG